MMLSIPDYALRIQKQLFQAEFDVNPEGFPFSCELFDRQASEQTRVDPNTTLVGACEAVRRVVPTNGLPYQNPQPSRRRSTFEAPSAR